MTDREEGLPRRDFLARLGRGGVRGVAAAGILYGLDAMASRPATRRPRAAMELGILRPPGALDESEFLQVCIRCDVCAEACDTACIQLMPIWEGRHAGTPYIRAESRACDLCLRCTQACPSGALRELTEMSDARMGTAVVDERLCVSHNGTGVCGACHTVCPLRNKAITQGMHNRPTVHPEHCVGCGLCEEACIVKDRRAIRVVSGRPWS